jgi:hypothetical protein
VASIVERVIRDAPNQVGVVYGALDPAKIQSVVVPVTSGANSQLAAELAPGFARQFGAAARAITIIRRDVSEPEAKALQAAAAKTLRDADMDAPLEVLRRREIGPALVRAVEPGELVLMGAPSTDPVAALLAETLPGVLARRGRAPMIVVRDVEAHHPGRFERFFKGRK